ncbi:MAG: transposase family protein [Verrucomicrobiae bacterium]|nr:transposase family protein [Verrucomicrobiae bacterium]
MLRLEADALGNRRRMRAFIFTPNVSRYRFVYPVERETTESAIEACEAAWEFYGGVFHVLVPDNTKAIVVEAHATAPRITRAFLEYGQARGFVVDPARVRRPQDKGRVERAVRDVRDDCFGGESLHTTAQARERALRWSRDEYGTRKHTTTQRLPREHFQSDERGALLPAPCERYDVPQFCEPKVGRDHLAQVVGAIYSLPTSLIGKRLLARADSVTVRFYDGMTLVKVHPRKPKGGRSIDPSDFPPERTPYAMRDVTLLASMAREHGEHVGQFAQALLAGPLPWTRMRRVRMLLGLARKFGDGRVEETCRLALAAEMHDVHRLENMLKSAARPDAAPLARVIPIGRYLRPPQQYALALSPSASPDPQGEE